MKLVLIPVAVMILCILVCGCTSGPANVPSPAPASPSTPAAMPASSPAKTYSATPGPVQTVPEYESVSVSVNRNVVSTDPTITVIYDGGKGLGMTTRMDVTVIRSDGVVETQSRDNPQMGTSITLMGTTGNDRVTVSVTMTSGNQYTIIDKYYPFPGSMVPS
ncbi:hypothetical protein [uncultured Methanoregula sp.]|uniref:hypothetical protein n=1 Tax=uncultured Methanoregula sp. TaxID=1005933 RepID=UPI002AAA6279|nr:hypothetical protein [uncultured Methanoregula sp.]